MKTNFLKLGALAIMIMVSSTINAQTTSGADNVAQADKAGESIRLIDNKGTIKYMQSNNGITTITSTEAGNKTTTTWQLGGALVSDTEIDFNGQRFSFASVTVQADIAATTTDDTGTGFTLLTRDEGTGDIKKILVTDLIQSGREEYTALALDETNNSATITATGMPLNLANVSVYRNGVKLRAGIDYTLTADTVTLVTTAAAPNDWAIYTNDIFEVHWIK